MSLNSQLIDKKSGMHTWGLSLSTVCASRASQGTVAAFWGFSWVVMSAMGSMLFHLLPSFEDAYFVAVFVVSHGT